MNGSTVRYLTMMFLSDSLLVVYFSCFLLVLQIWYHRGISSDHKSHSSNKFVQFCQNESFCMCLWMLWPVWSLSASKVYRTPDLHFHTVFTFVCFEASNVFTFFMNPLHQYLYPSNEVFQGFPVLLTCVEQESCHLESVSISCVVMHHICSLVLIFCFCLLHEDSIRGSVTFHFLILDEILLKIKFQFWFCYFGNKCIALLLIEAISKLTWCHIWISTSSL